jgi:hypothetical protein
MLKNALFTVICYLLIWPFYPVSGQACGGWNELNLVVPDGTDVTSSYPYLGTYQQKDAAIREILGELKILNTNTNIWEFYQEDPCPEVCPNGEVCLAVGLIGVGFWENFSLKQVGQNWVYSLKSASEGYPIHKFMIKCSCEEVGDTVACNNSEVAILSTGWNHGTNTAITPPGQDQNWKLVYNSGQSISPINSKVIEASTYWEESKFDARWISNDIQGTTNSAAGLSMFETEFSIFNLDPSLTLHLVFWADDSGSVFLNGYPIFVKEKALTESVSTTIDDINKFNLGINRLKVNLDNVVGPHGFMMQAYLTSCIPNSITARDDELPGGAAIRIYPNPASKELHIDNIPRGGKASFVIYDLYGKVYLESEQPEIDISGLSGGVFLLEINIGNRKYYHRFIKEH